MSESLRNDGRVWVPKKVEDCKKDPLSIKEEDRDYYLERIYPAFGNLVPRDVASRGAKRMVDEGRGVGKTGIAVYLDFADAIKRLGKDTIEARYGNLFEMYQRITDESPYERPMRIYPAVHYTMGGLWVNYELGTTVPGLYALGECNFSDHGANRLGASALMQGLADGYFVIPYTVGAFLSTQISVPAISTDHPEFAKAEKNVQNQIDKLMGVGGAKSVDHFHKQLGKIMWEYCGMSRNGEGLKKAIAMIGEVKKEFWADVRIPGEKNEFNPELEKAWRVIDLIELGELMCYDALDREESCGGHFREEYKTEEGEARRRDPEYTYVAAWEYTGDGKEPSRHKEVLEFNNIELKTRSYK